MSLDDWGRPQPPRDETWKKFVVVGIVVLSIVVAGVIGALLSAGLSPDPDAPKNPALASSLDELESTEVEEAPTSRSLTLMSFTEVWNKNTETEKDDLCMAVELFGPSEAADQLSVGATADGELQLDWDYMVELIEEECASR